MKYFIYLQYDGANYHGWQSQPNAVSVQETIEKKLSMLLRRELFIVGAGRTDAGVNASLMVAHFVLNENNGGEPGADGMELLDCERLTMKLNGVLPEDISIIRIVPVRKDAHARFSPISRTYKYYVTRTKNPYRGRYACRLFWDLDINLMNEAARHLFDYIDFTSFSKLHTDTKTNNCRIMEAHWDEIDSLAEGPSGMKGYVFTIKADRFLRNMVRAIVGTLMQVGRHKITVEEFCQIIEKKDRCTAGDSAPGEALFLTDIEYPEDIFL